MKKKLNILSMLLVFSLSFVTKALSNESNKIIFDEKAYLEEMLKYENYNPMYEESNFKYQMTQEEYEKTFESNKPRY